MVNRHLKVFVSVFVFVFVFVPVFVPLAKAQAPRTSFGMEDFSFSHELNPAMQPDSGYWSLPLLGNTSMSLSSTLKLGDLIYDKSDGTITTFMNSGTISKTDLMDRVGSGLNTSFDMRMTIASIGNRTGDKRYQTYSLTWRTQVDIFLDKGLFDVMKEVENRLYTIDKTSLRASSYLELAFGESRRLDSHWTAGAKVKVLLGFINADAELHNMSIDLSTGKWIAQGKADMNVSGLEYKTKQSEYKSKQGSFTQVNGLKLASPGLQGVGAAIDAGATYTLNNHWTFSAAVLDLGFITWLNSRKAENSGNTFEFDGFHDISTKKDNEHSLVNQWNNIADDLMDMAHLEEASTGTSTHMVACTVNAGATYRYGFLTASALFTERLYGRNSSWESRLNINARPVKRIDFTVGPACSSYGVGLGGMIRWNPGLCQLYIATDRFFTTMNKQFVPTSLNTSLHFGMTIPL